MQQRPALPPRLAKKDFAEEAVRHYFPEEDEWTLKVQAKTGGAKRRQRVSGYDEDRKDASGTNPGASKKGALTHRNVEFTGVDCDIAIFATTRTRATIRMSPTIGKQLSLRNCRPPAMAPAAIWFYSRTLVHQSPDHMGVESVASRVIKELKGES
ncbi:hypothetical protein H0H92_012640 [Tricholoma furcatifolium]|nr:hypothetical protein H0H92_012640 [Tricholoma furcatifolium]